MKKWEICSDREVIGRIFLVERLVLPSLKEQLKPEFFEKQ